MRTLNRRLNNDGPFSSVNDITINGIEAGRGAGNVASNTAFGDTALDSNTTGSNNTAVGINALTSNTSGQTNTAVGSSALTANNVGVDNTAVGYNALSSQSSSSNNVAVGRSALESVMGSSNTGIGRNAGSNLTTGSNNAFLGNGAQPSAVGVSNEITLGDSSVATLRCQVTTITALSDARDKKDIEDIQIGLEFINALRPVKFTWARRDGTKEGVQESGFIAQDLDAVQMAFGAEDYLRLVLKSNPDKLEATPGNLLPVLVKAIQELKAEFLEYKALHP